MTTPNPTPHLRSLFHTENPFATPLTATHPTRPSRSPSSSSTASFRSATSAAPPSLASILTQSFPARNGSFASTSSFSQTGAFGARRASCFSILEMEEEKAEFGERVVGVLEPRPGVGWWGVGEVLEEGRRESLF